MENEEDKFSRTTAFKGLRAREAEEDSRWTGKVSLIIGTIAALAVIAAMIYFIF